MPRLELEFLAQAAEIGLALLRGKAEFTHRPVENLRVAPSGNPHGDAGSNEADDGGDAERDESPLPAPGRLLVRKEQLVCSKPGVGEYSRLGLCTVPPAVFVAVLALWASVRLLGV